MRTSDLERKKETADVERLCPLGIPGSYANRGSETEQASSDVSNLYTKDAIFTDGIQFGKQLCDHVFHAVGRKRLSISHSSAFHRPCRLQYIDEINRGNDLVVVPPAYSSEIILNSFPLSQISLPFWPMSYYSGNYTSANYR